MISMLSRVPERLQKPIATGLCGVAALGVLGAIGFFADFSTKTKTSGHLMWKETHERPFDERLPSLIGGIVFVAVAMICLVVALILITAHGRLMKYPPILAGQEVVKIEQIASITGAKPSQIYRDIQTLIDGGIITDYYLDRGAQQVVSRKYVPQQSHKTVVRCPACGTSNELIVGIPRPCTGCGEPLAVPAG